MAITMTKKGQLPPERFYIGRCSSCKSEYRAQQKDLTYECDYRESSYVHKCTLAGCTTLVCFLEER